jgi:hypothetical protein
VADPYRYISEGKLVELVKEMVSIPSTTNKETGIFFQGRQLNGLQIRSGTLLKAQV